MEEKRIVVEGPSPCVATMDTLGYIGDEQPELMIDRHFGYWMAAKQNQSTILSEVPSFDYVVKTNQGNLDQMVSGVRIALENYFAELFSEVSADVSATSISENYGTYILNISMKVVFKGKEYDLNRSIENSGNTYKLVREGMTLYERAK